jgi:hypothetical protein
MLHSVMAHSSGVGSLPGEGHVLWNAFHDEHRRGWTSQATRPEEVAPGERRALGWMIAQIAGDRRYLDKTPRNSLQVPYLHRLFPDAWFVFLVRDGRATVSSLLGGWRDTSGMFPGRRPPIPLSIDGYDGETWKFVVPPGWQRYASGHTLAEVCAFQWVASTEALLAAKGSVPPSRWVEVRYERLVAAPSDEVPTLMASLQLPPDPEVADHARTLDRNITKAVSAPRPEKWREENPDEIAQVMPLIAPTMRRLGYDV